MDNSHETPTNEIEVIARIEAFEKLINSFDSKNSKGSEFIEYNLPYPKELFLKYLAEEKDFLLHGSGEELNTLEPQQANDAHKESGNKKAVYAVTDAALSIFYAIKDRSKIKGNVISGRTHSNGEVSYHFVMPKDSLEKHPYKEGVVYILNKADFNPEYDEGIHSNEWTSFESITPWAKLKVGPEDFQYLNEVQSSE